MIQGHSLFGHKHHSHTTHAVNGEQCRRSYIDPCLNQQGVAACVARVTLHRELALTLSSSRICNYVLNLTVLGQLQHGWYAPTSTPSLMGFSFSVTEEPLTVSSKLARRANALIAR